MHKIMPLDKGVKLKISFLIFQAKHMWVLKRTVSFEQPEHMFKLMGKKIFTILH